MDPPAKPERLRPLEDRARLLAVERPLLEEDVARLREPAARDFGARGVGVDINPVRIAEARENAQSAGVTDRVRFEENDLFQADIREATVVTLYLLTSVNLKLRPKLLAELRPGTRIVSNTFDMGDWKPDQEINLDGRRILLWTVPASGAARPRPGS